MKLIETTDAALGRVPRGEYARIVKEFAESDMEYAEVSDIRSSIASAYHSLTRAIKNLGYPVHAAKSGDKVYLVRGVC